MTPFRGKYASEREAARLFLPFGGLVGAIDSVMERSEDPLIGVIETEAGSAAAIWRRPFWAFLSPGGVKMAKGDAIAGWRECRQQ